MNFNNNWYLVTGGSSGIGRAVVMQITQSGGKVIVVGSNEDKLKKVIKEIPSGNLYCKIDLSNLEEIKKIFELAKNNNIIFSGMVHCAGVSPLALIKENTIELMEKTFSINTFSFFELVKYFQEEEHSFERSSIVAVSSITAKKSGYRQTVYGTSKAALSASINLMANELLNREIRINAVSPGVTDTPMLDEMKVKAFNLEEKVKSGQPLGIIDAEGVADAIMFLLSDKARYITGIELICDGGAMLR